MNGFLPAGVLVNRTKKLLVESLPASKPIKKRDDDSKVAATRIVTYDKDLLALKKPLGIEIIRPPQFLRRIKA